MSTDMRRVVLFGTDGAVEETERLAERFRAAGLAAESAPSPDDVEHPESVVGIIAPARVKIGPAELDRFPGLRVLGTPSVGLDHVDVAAAGERGIPVVNAAGYNSAAVAEYALTAILLLMKDFPLGQELVRNHEWSDRRTDPLDLENATIGLIGFGGIARRLARLLHALGIRTIVWNRSAIGSRPEASLVEYVPAMTDLLGLADVVSLHVPLVESTRGMVDDAFLSAMREGSGLVNTSRGALVDSVALERALGSGHLRGAVLDVLPAEPPSWDDPVLSGPRTVITPHQAWLTRQTRHLGYDMAASAIIRGVGSRP